MQILILRAFLIPDQTGRQFDRRSPQRLAMLLDQQQTIVRGPGDHDDHRVAPVDELPAASFGQREVAPAVQFDRFVIW